MSPTPLTARSARVKALRRLHRRSVRLGQGEFLAEGPNAVEAAVAAGAVREVFVLAGAGDEATRPVLDGLADDVPRTPVDERALAALTDAVTPSGVVALCRLVDVPLREALVGGFVVIGDGVNDPGNAGTVVRTADAAGAGGVVLAGASVDVHNAKTVRASAGSVFHLPVTQGVDTLEAVQAAKDAGFQVLATALHDGVDLLAADDLLAAPTAWLLGSEAHGLPPALLEAADHRVSIPMSGRAESLNLAAAAAVCLYASARARPRLP